MTRGPATTEGSSIETLSPRQREVIELIAKGLSNDDIGRVLGIAAATVRSHVSQLLLALDVDNRTEAAAVYSAWAERPGRTAVVLARPALAVHPVVALDDEPSLRTMAAGLSADLAALFARWSWFPVIFDPPPPGPGPGARAAVDADVRFRFSGSLRRSGAGLRLIVSLDDGERGPRLWTERYDLAATELFEVEDLMCSAIVAAAYPVLIAHSLADVGRFPAALPGELPAWEHAHRAMALQQRREVGSNAAAQAGFAAALTRDPRLVLAHFGLGLASYDEVLHQSGDRSASLTRLRTCAERCLTLAPHASEGYFLLGRLHHAHNEYALAAAPLEIAIRLNPSFAPAHALLAQLLVLDGRFDDGLARVQHAMRLSPRSQVAGLAVVQFVCGHYADALIAAERALSTHPEYPFGRAIAAVAAHRLGHTVRARGHHDALRRLAPTFAPAGFGSSFGPHVPGIARFVETLDELDHAARALPA